MHPHPGLLRLWHASCKGSSEGCNFAIADQFAVCWSLQDRLQDEESNELLRALIARLLPQLCLLSCLADCLQDVILGHISLHQDLLLLQVNVH